MANKTTKKTTTPEPPQCAGCKRSMVSGTTIRTEKKTTINYSCDRCGKRKKVIV